MARRHYERLPEPPIGALIKFIRDRSYTFLALRQPHGSWETTATDYGRGFREVMTWAEITRKVRKFEYATGVDRVDPVDDPRVREDRAVVLYSSHGHRIAALYISRLEYWYTTDDASLAYWHEILSAARGEVHLVTSWIEYKSRLLPASTNG